MADSVSPLGSWTATDTTVGEILAVLDSLRREAPAGTATRTAVLTIVAVTADARECARAAGALRRIGTSHPARTVGIVAHAAPRPLTARIDLYGIREAGRTLWSEDIEIELGPPLTAHLDSLIEPLTLPDVPVVAWYVDQVPELPDALADAADAVIVDGRDLAAPDAFSAIEAMGRLRPVVDLSWFRLRPWREVLASLFEGAYRPFVHGVTDAEVRGKTGPRRLLAGWLADRLELPRRSFHLVDAEHAAVRLVAHDGDRSGEFSVVRRGDERALVATADIAPDPAHRSIRLLPDADVAWGLHDALTALPGDPLYARALAAATALAL